MVLYDATTLWFTSDKEDKVRKPGRGKEHRPGPQIQVGLLVDQSGFPLEVHLFAGNKAETTTLLPVLDGYQRRHGQVGIIVVADAGMLSAGNLAALEDAGYDFIVGARNTQAEKDLAAYFATHGDYFKDGQTVEATRVMGQGAKTRIRRVVWAYSFKRHKRDDRVINDQILRAEKIADGTAKLRKSRFLKVEGAVKSLDQAMVDRARRLAGLKGYVTSLSCEQMGPIEVAAAYRDLFNIEASFRMAKSDLKTRPVFSHEEQAIEAHITIAMAALAVARHLYAVTGVPIKRLVKTLRQVRSATVEVNGELLDLPPVIPDKTQQILNTINSTGH
jgi:transposase